MTILIGIISSLLEWIIQKLASWGVVEIESIITKIKIKEQAAADAAALLNSKTEDAQKAAESKVITDTFPNT